MSMATRYPKSLWSHNPIPGGCVLYLPLWSPGLNGSAFKSVDPYGHTCTVTGALLKADGRLFDGLGDKIALPLNTFTSLTTGTIIFWAKAAAIGDAFSFAKGTSDYITISAQTTARVQIDLIVASSRKFLIRTPGFPQDAWTHIAWSKTGSTHLVYSNGVSQTITWVSEVDKSAYFNSIPTNNTLQVGSTLNILGKWSGRMGEFWLYDRALSADEVLYNYNNSYPRRFV